MPFTLYKNLFTASKSWLLALKFEFLDLASSGKFHATSPLKQITIKILTLTHKNHSINTWHCISVMETILVEIIKCITTSSLIIFLSSPSHCFWKKEKREGGREGRRKEGRKERWKRMKDWYRWREQMDGSHQGGKAGWNELGDWDWHIYITDTTYQIDT